MIIQWTQGKTGLDMPRKYGTMKIQRVFLFPPHQPIYLLVYSIFLWLSQKRLMQIACHNCNCFFLQRWHFTRSLFPDTLLGVLFSIKLNQDTGVPICEECINQHSEPWQHRGELQPCPIRALHSLKVLLDLKKVGHTCSRFSRMPGRKVMLT